MTCKMCESVRQKCGHTNNVCVNIWGTPIQCQCFEGQVSKPYNDQGMRPRPNDTASCDAYCLRAVMINNRCPCRPDSKSFRGFKHFLILEKI